MIYELERASVKNLREQILGWVECGKYMTWNETFYKMLVAERALSDYLEFCHAKDCENTCIDFPNVATWPHDL